ncbi:MAG: hypothetical protein HY015_05205 [Bacteroidetes bacterium]|nr:hypothetical protein [Bacteroidota bacterium]MBI3482358.1 hypothetical protein [Bacteroidota bacterium]
MGVPFVPQVALSLLATSRTFHFGLKHAAPSLTQSEHIEELLVILTHG